MKTLTKNYLVALLTSDYFLKDFKHIDKLDIITTDNGGMRQGFMVYYYDKVVEITLIRYNDQHYNCWWSCSGHIFQVPAQQLTIITKRIENEMQEGK